MKDLWVFLRFLGAPGIFGDWYWPDGIKLYPVRDWCGTGSPEGKPRN